MVFSRRSSIRPVNSRKNVKDQQGGLAIGTQTTVALADAVDAPTLASPVSVATGSVINGFFLNVQVRATTEAALPNAYMAVAKNTGNNLTFPDANAVGVDDNKRFVIHQEMAMLSGSTEPSIPITLFKGVIKVPKHMRRMGPDDQWQCLLFSPGVTADFCVQCIYKWYF